MAAADSGLDIVCDVSIEYLWGEVSAGADVLPIFDSWGLEARPTRSSRAASWAFAAMEPAATSVANA